MNPRNDQSLVISGGGGSRMPAYDPPCRQCGHNPEGQIHKHEINGKHRSLVQAEIPGAALRQEKQKKRGQRGQDIEESDDVKPIPGTLYKQSKKDSPQSTPEKRLVDVGGLQGER